MTPKIIDTYKFKFCKGTIELHKPGYIIFKDQDNGNIEYYKLSFSLPRPEIDLDYITDTDKKEIQNKRMYRNLSSLLNELSELGVLISDTQDLLKQVPGDTIVEFQLEQLKHRQSELN
ncbi:MAG TPA: hypothetical protein P5301_00525 [Bacteroidales bacterium]|nr:hypothetical protein [Bacteroidales bacterium]HRR51943.1 hypothetical protein [Bacteroidales bacterium]